MKFITVQSLNNDSMKVFISESSSSSKVRGVIHIYHGLAEYFGRYKETVTVLNALGFHVIGIDHRGHGNWIESGSLPGYFAKKNGWNLVVEDMKVSFQHIQSLYKDIPHYILAHSMGTWLTLSLLQTGISPSKVILSASSKLSTKLLFLQKSIINIIKFFRGGKSKSYFSDFLTTKQFNSAFKPNRTSHDWLSRDNKSVDEYVESSLCGFVASNQLYLDLANGVINTFKNEEMLKIPNDIPILLIAGTKDPVGENGEGVKALEKFLNKYLNSVSMILLSGLRHEILNEIEKDQAINEIINFIDQ